MESDIMDIHQLIQSPESEILEFKKTFGKEAIISLTAFANSRGGRVVVGVDSNGKVSGIRIGAETIQQYLNEIKLATYPQILPHVDLYEIDGKAVLVFEVREYPIKPIACKNRYYRRVKNSNHLLSLDEIVDLQQQSLNISFDAYPLKDNLSSLDESLMNRFIDRVNSRGRINLLDDLLMNLTKLKMIQNGSPTLAAMLLFGNHGYSIHIGRFKAADTIIDDLLIKEPLPEALEEALIFIKKHINLSYEFDGSLQRTERWQYPIEVIREVLLNSVVHRDYKSTSDIVIKIFDDRIVFANPGRLYGHLTIEDLQRDDYVSSLRNRLLAEAFYLSGDIEKYGTGFVRIRRMLKDHGGVSIQLSEMGDFFRVELLRSSVGSDGEKRTHLPEDLPVKLHEKLPVKLSTLQQTIVSNMSVNPDITYDRLAALTGKSREAIRSNINQLKQKAIIERIGSDKSGRWRVLISQKVANP